MFHESQIFCNTYNIFKILVNIIKIFQKNFFLLFIYIIKGVQGRSQEFLFGRAKLQH